jgi:hypothetical protein
MSTFKFGFDLSNENHESSTDDQTGTKIEGRREEQEELKVSAVPLTGVLNNNANNTTENSKMPLSSINIDILLKNMKNPHDKWSHGEINLQNGTGTNTDNNIHINNTNNTPGKSTLTLKRITQTQSNPSKQKTAKTREKKWVLEYIYNKDTISCNKYETKVYYVVLYWT